MITALLDAIHAPSWRVRASCRGVDGQDFFPPSGGERRRERRQRELRAKAVCAGCPVRGECLDAALANDERYGVWGGLTDGERAVLILAAS